MKSFALMLSLLLFSGCVATHQQRTATQGAVIGGAAGAVIGAQSNRVAEGAVVGAIVGGLAGAILAEDRSNRVYASEARYHRRACNKGSHYFSRAHSARNLDRKINLMREGLRFCPNNPAAHNDLGVALVLRGNHAAARTHFGHAIRLDSSYRPAHRNLRHLQNYYPQRSYNNDRRDRRDDKYQRRDSRSDERRERRDEKRYQRRDSGSDDERYDRRRDRYYDDD